MLKEPVNGASPAERLVAAWSSRMVLTKLSVQGPRDIPPSMKALIRLTFVPAGDVSSILRSVKASVFQVLDNQIDVGDGQRRDIQSRSDPDGIVVRYSFRHIGTAEPLRRKTPSRASVVVGRCHNLSRENRQQQTQQDGRGHTMNFHILFLRTLGLDETRSVGWPTQDCLCRLC